MKFGIQLPQEGAHPRDVIAHAQRAEELGYDAVFIPDHLAAVAVAPGTPCYEAWTLMTAVAAATDRIAVGSLVLSEAFRNPAWLANAAATLQTLSDGRLILGLGAGWYEAEYRAYGFPWHPAGERVERLAESLEIIRRFWAGDGEGFSGRFHAAGGTRDTPHERAPIWIGGIGPKLLEVAARYADAWNAPVLAPEQVAERAGWLRERRPDIAITWEGPVWIDEDEGRVRDRLERNRTSDNPTARRYAQTAVAGTPEQVAARIKEYEAAGVGFFVCHFGKTTDLRGTELFARSVIPVFG